MRQFFQVVSVVVSLAVFAGVCALSAANAVAQQLNQAGALTGASKLLAVN